MKDYLVGSYQQSGHPPSEEEGERATEDEELGALMFSDMRTASTSRRSSFASLGENSERPKKSRLGCSLPFFIAASIWVLCMAVEFSPFAFIVVTSGWSNGGDNSNNGDAATTAVHHHKRLHRMQKRREKQKRMTAKILGRSSPTSWWSQAFVPVTDVRSCTVEECASSPCEEAIIKGRTIPRPYNCLSLRRNENVRGGCGETPWAKDICAIQCDATNCADLLNEEENGFDDDDDNLMNSILEESSPPLHCDVDCSKEWCETGRLCGGGDSVYQCTSGASVFGCSPDRYLWTVRTTEADCSSCCKTTTCSPKSTKKEATST